MTPSSDGFAFTGVAYVCPEPRRPGGKRGTFHADIGQSEWSHFMPRLLALVIAASIFGTSTAALAAPAPERVRGTVKSISDTVLIVHTMSGTDGRSI